MIRLGVIAKDSNAELTTFFLIIRENERRVKISLPIKEPASAYDSVAKLFKGTPTSELSTAILTKWRAEAMKQIQRAELEDMTIHQVAVNIKEALTGKKIEKEDKSALIVPFYYKWATEGTARKTNPTRQNLYHCRTFEEFVLSRGKKNMTFNEVTYALYTDFIAYLRTKKNLKENTIGVHISDLKAIMNEAYKLKLHANTDYQTFEKPSEFVDKVFFTEDEIERIYKAKLSPMQDKVRDIIVMGCYVAQRHSDYSVLTKDDVLQDGFIHITQQKTKKRILIPIHPIVQKILDKYNGYPPELSMQVINREIKKIAKSVGINDKIKVTEVKGGIRKTFYKEKWEMVSTHTARRSGVTNALLSGVSRQDCMYLAGISSEAVFNNYICITKEEYARRLADTTFFTNDKESSEIMNYVQEVLKSGRNPKWLQMLRDAMG